MSYALLRASDMNIPAIHRQVNTANATCIVFMRSATGTSYRDMFPTTPETTMVMMAIPEAWPVFLMVARIEFATPNFEG